MAIRGINHIAVRVEDLERSVNFYTTVFGMQRRAPRPNGNPDIAFVELGELAIELMAGLPGEALSPGRIDHIAFEVDDIEATIAQIMKVAPDIKFPPISVRPTGTKTVIFLDPDGARLQLWQRPD